MYITTSHNPSKKTIVFSYILSYLIPLSIFVRRGVKTFDKLLRDARRHGMNRVLVVMEENKEPRYLRVISVSENVHDPKMRLCRYIKPVQYQWEDLISYEIKKVVPSDFDAWIILLKRLKKKIKEGYKKERKEKIIVKERRETMLRFFKCNRYAEKLFGVEKTVSEIFEGSDIIVYFDGQGQRRRLVFQSNIYDFEFILVLEQKQELVCLNPNDKRA